MDGFVWEDEHERTADRCVVPQPLRVYFGPTFPLERLAYLPRTAGHPPPPSSLLEVPASGKNFLISPPGSPPVGWEQIEEHAPNQRTFHEGDTSDDEVDFAELKKAGGGDDDRWADELTKALRFLSVQGGGGSDDEDDVDDGAPDSDGDEVMDGPCNSDQRSSAPTTQLVLAPAPLPPSSASSSSGLTRGAPDSPTLLRPAVTVSSPPLPSRSDSPSSPPSATATPPPGAARISSVKATIESMLGGAGDARITPTARPPLV
ncbi:Proteophosphoglycan ppg4 [Rhodotorula diobovata]|uniref:Proteophosphoglycan ppg4 n=1 Tax=Rhodotorula diobovata TaxID=5288 RepID=A0A5C5FWV2_9BASI|nr:Proteophosphoglycan ppg4 [Rhodotorula diobovata]